MTKLFAPLGVLEKSHHGVTCHLCGKTYKSLGVHAWRSHGMDADEYRAEFKLPWRSSLEAPELGERQREHRVRNTVVGRDTSRELWLENGEWAASVREKLSEGQKGADRGGAVMLRCDACQKGFRSFKSAAASAETHYCKDCVAYYHKRAGWRLHDTFMHRVRTDPEFRAKARDRALKANAASVAKRLRPAHPCKMCGLMIPARLRVCSDACLRKSRSESAKVTGLGRAVSAETREKMRVAALQREAAKRS